MKVAMEKLGVKIAETKVGDRYVLERMLESGAAVGGEQSGHIILSHYNTTGDGLAAALRLLTVVQQSGKPLSELAQIMQKMPQYMLNPTVKDKEGWREDEEIMKLITQAQQRLEGHGRILVRPSGTEPKIRVMAEGEDAETIKVIVEEIAELIGRKMG